MIHVYRVIKIVDVVKHAIYVITSVLTVKSYCQDRSCQLIS